MYIGKGCTFRYIFMSLEPNTSHPPLSQHKTFYLQFSLLLFREKIRQKGVPYVAGGFIKIETHPFGTKVFTYDIELDTRSMILVRGKHYKKKERKREKKKALWLDRTNRNLTYSHLSCKQYQILHQSLGSSHNR